MGSYCIMGTVSVWDDDKTLEMENNLVISREERWDGMGIEFDYSQQEFLEGVRTVLHSEVFCS